MDTVKGNPIFSVLLSALCVSVVNPSWVSLRPLRRCGEFFCLWLLLAAGCAASMRPVPPASGGLPALSGRDLQPAGGAAFGASAEAWIEVEDTGTALLVRPAIDGRDAGWFVFDTGATATTISSAAAARLGLAAVGRSALQGRHETTVFEAGSLALGPLTLREPRLIGMDVPASSLLFGRRSDGFIGYDVLTAAVVELDLGAGRVALHDPASFDLGGAGAWQPLVLYRRLPHVACRFEGGGAGVFLIDTGWSGSVWLFAHAVAAHDLLDGRPTRGRTIQNLGASTPVRTGRIAWFELGGVRLDDVEADFSLKPVVLYPGPAEVPGVVGTALLRRFRVVLDYQHQRLALIPP